MGLQVGGHEPVGHEVAVVGGVAELAAVGEPHRAVREALAQGLVLPLPKEAPLEAGGRLDHVPVVGQRAVAVAHGVAVLAHDQRPPARAGLAVAADGVDLRVHGAHDVGDGRAAVLPAAAADGRLVVQRPGRVRFPDPCGQSVVIGPVAGLVAEAPHDHRRMVPVPLHHAGAAVHEGVPVGGVVADGVLVSVALDVGLVHDVEAQLVAERVERVVVRVVGRADRVDVVEAHKPQVVPHVLDGHGLAPVGVMVMAVHAEDPDRAAVHQQLPVAHLHPADSHPLRLDLDDAPVGAQQLGGQGVEPGRLRAPRLGLGEVPSRARLGSGGVRVVLMGHGCLNDRSRRPAGGVVQLEPHRPARLRTAAEVDRSRRRDPPCARCRIEVGRHADVADMDAGARLDPHRAVQTGHPPLILVLDVAVSAVPHHHDGQIVGLPGQQTADLVLAREAAVGAISREPAVDVDRVDALRTGDVQHDGTGMPSGRNSHGAPIDAGWVARRQSRRRAVERHLDVGVVGLVDEHVPGGVREILHGPVPGHGCSHRVRPDAGQRLGRHLVGAVEQLERPDAVEPLAPESVQRDVHRQPVHLKDRRVLPRSQLSKHRQHGPEP